MSPPSGMKDNPSKETAWKQVASRALFVPPERPSNFKWNTLRYTPENKNLQRQNFSLLQNVRNAVVPIQFPIQWYWSVIPCWKIGQSMKLTAHLYLAPSVERVFVACCLIKHMNNFGFWSMRWIPTSLGTTVIWNYSFVLSGPLHFYTSLLRPSNRRLSAKLVPTFVGIVRLRTKGHGVF
jgi:hypothetical protein